MRPTSDIFGTSVRTNKKNDSLATALKMSQGELFTETRLREQSLALKLKKNQAVQTLLRTLSYLVVAAVFFGVHWTFFRRCERTIE